MKLLKAMPLIVMFIMLFTESAYADKPLPVIDVSHQWEVTNIHGPSQVGISDSIAVDLNSDGWMDVVSASIDDGHLRAYINPKNNLQSTDLKYVQQIIEENEIGLYRLISTDLNGDLRPDLVVTSIDSHRIISYLQQKDGGFDKAIIAEDILLPTDVVADDFNGDGLMDLASISFENNQVYQHLQQAAGGFSVEVIAENVLRPRKMTTADWNQDGLIDIAVASEEDNSVRVLFNKSNVSWSERILTETASGTRNLTSCDLDHNGMVDLVVSHTADNTLLVYHNFGVWPYQPTTIDDSALGVNAVICQDLNHNGQNDLAAIHAQSGIIFSYFQHQGFTPNLVANSRDGYITLDAADFNNNQQVQVLTQAHFQQRNLLYKPDAQNDEQVIWQDFPDGAYHLEIGDFNQDGLEDVAYVAFHENKIYWAEKILRGYKVHLIFDDVDGPQSISVGDIDHDGDLDIVSAGAWDDTFRLHTNEGAGLFSTTELFTEANNAARSKIVDINGDGINDVVITSSLDDSVRWIDLSNGQPEIHLIGTQMDGALAFDTLDYDQDGDADIVVGNFFGNEVVVLINLSNNIFVPVIIEDNFIKPNDVIFCDIDNKSNGEVLFGSATESVLKVAYLEQTNAISTGVLFTGLLGLSGVRCLDADNNGWNDIISSSKNEELIKFHFNHFLKFKTKIISNIGRYRSISLKVKVNSVIIKAASYAKNVIREFILIDKIFSDSFD